MLFANVYGIGQMLPVDSPCTYYLDCIGTPVAPTLKNDFVNAMNAVIEKPDSVHLTLSMTFPDLAEPESVIAGMELLDKEFPGIFRWMGEVNLVKQALFGNDHEAVPLETIGEWAPFMAVLRERGIPLAIHSDLGNDADPTRYLPWIEGGSPPLSRQQDYLDASRAVARAFGHRPGYAYLAFWNSLFDRYPNMMADISWRVIRRQFVLRPGGSGALCAVHERPFGSHPAGDRFRGFGQQEFRHLSRGARRHQPHPSPSRRRKRSATSRSGENYFQPSGPRLQSAAGLRAPGDVSGSPRRPSRRPTAGGRRARRAFPRGGGAVGFLGVPRRGPARFRETHRPAAERAYPHGRCGVFSGAPGEAPFPPRFSTRNIAAFSTTSPMATRDNARARKRAALPQMTGEIPDFVRGLNRVLIPSGHLFLWVDKFHLCMGVHEWLRGSGFDIVDMITWHKRRFGMGYRSRRTSEHLLVLQKAAAQSQGGSGRPTTSPMCGREDAARAAAMACTPNRSSSRARSSRRSLTPAISSSTRRPVRSRFWTHAATADATSSVATSMAEGNPATDRESGAARSRNAPARSSGRGGTRRRARPASHRSTGVLRTPPKPVRWARSRWSRR